MLKNLLQEVE